MFKRVFVPMTMTLFLLLLGVTQAGEQTMLKDKVKATLANQFYNDFDVTVSKDHRVTIEGEVNSLYDKMEAFDAVAKLPGVRTISNQIIVDAPVVADDVIEANIKQEMEYVTSLWEPEKINVKSADGIVVLSGTVSFNREKNVMETIVSWQKGVKGIVNEMKVLPPKKAKSDENLEQILSQILNNEFPREDNVEFNVNDGVVTLNGTAGSLWAKYNIANEFMDVISITEVDNNLAVEPLL